jgi:hypothetical protein
MANDLQHISRSSECAEAIHQLGVHFQTSTHPATRSAFGGG